MPKPASKLLKFSVGIQASLDQSVEILAASWYHSLMSVLDESTTMQLASSAEIPAIQAVYAEAVVHAKQVGFIDWPDRFPLAYLAELADNQELFCFHEVGQVVAAVRLLDLESPTVWPDDSHHHLYIGKFATGDAVRDRSYAERVMLPAVTIEAGRRDRVGLRLACLAANHSLRRFYSSQGFEIVGESEIFSEFIAELVKITQFERPI